MGAGSIGGYLRRGSRSDERTTFIARGANLQAINAQGFRLIEEDGTEHVARNVRAVQKAADAGPQDFVLLALKAHQVGALAADVPAMFGPDTAVVTLQNGIPWWYFHKLGGEFDGRPVKSVDPDGVIAAAIPNERIIGSVVYPASELVRPASSRSSRGTASRWANRQRQVRSRATDLRRAEPGGFKSTRCLRTCVRDLAQALGQPHVQSGERCARRWRRSAASPPRARSPPR